MSDIYTEDCELGRFLSRPVLIQHRVLPVGLPFSPVDYSIWTEYFSNPQIKRKLENYGYIQCKLKVKVVVNSTPFVYGAYGLSYHPMVTLSPIDSNSDDPIFLSQRQTIWIEPHNGSGGEMELPFFHYKNWLELTSTSEVDNMGKMRLWQLVENLAANASLTTPPSLSIYAWAEDVRLAANTVKLTLQSKQEEVRPAEKTNDEYGETPVAKAASAGAGVSATIAEMTTGVPYLGAFARATTIGAGILSSVASIFGFTNVPVIENAMPYKSMPFHGLASSEIGNVVDKLTLDPKNELSISPETVGLPAIDELSIPYLTGKEAIIDTILWESSDASDSMLFQAAVTPTICNIESLTDQRMLKDTPMGFVSRLFSNWRGDIIVRVRVIASQYHKGRLRVSFDPVGDIFADADSTTVVQTKIVDIADSMDMQFRIPYMAPQSWLRVRPTPVTDHSQRLEAAPVLDNDFHNGAFTIRVLNTLSAPIDTAPATLVVSVRAADNFEVTNPSDIDFGDEFPSYYTVQSKDMHWDDEVTQHVMGVSTPPPKNRYLVNMGEQIQSLRPLLRRSFFINSERSNDTSVSDTYSTYYKFTQTKYPPSFGYDPQGIHDATSLTGGAVARFNYCTNNPITWVTSAFIGQRGSMIWHYNVNYSKFVDTMRVRRLTETDVTSLADLRNLTVNFGVGSYSNVARGSITRAGPGVSGLSVVNQRTQAGLSVLMPQYSKFRFVSTNPDTTNFGSDMDDSENEKFVFEMITSNESTSVPFYERYCSIGTDYNVFYFLNVPPRYLYGNPSAGST
jgi:hypothetical protein